MESIKWLKKVYKVTGKLTDLDFDYAKDIHKDETRRQLSMAIALYLEGHSFSEIIKLLKLK